MVGILVCGRAAPSRASARFRDKPRCVTIPHPKRDIPIGTLRSIEKQSGLKLR
ncbi:addiction module toxin, HicA family [Mesorhizobium sp. SARCC-RB16n]|nr:addiction module toxin, HicA family [Mesorhizobium sp. SARCC-RB16n]